jgi:hypothetical protein
LAVAVSFGCNVDENGLAATNQKLQRDGGGTGGLVIVGSGGDVGSGGGFGSGSGGNLGDGGSSASGGTNGSGGMVAVGTGGSSASGGEPGSGGMAGAIGAGGVMDTGGTSGAGGINGGGGTPATGGTTGMGGAIATGGTPGTGGTSGTGSGGTGGGKGMGGNPGAGGSAMRCGPSNCTGCCGADGQCVHTVTATQCGKAGAACVACAPCEICSTSGLTGASCAIDPASQWAIVAVSGQVSTTPPGGGTWDPLHGDEGGTAPDLFCEYENPSGSVSPTTTGVTDTITDVFAANWDQTITPTGVTVSASALMASKPAWRIWVGDEDCSQGKCGTAGQTACSYQQPISAASLTSGGTTIHNYQNCLVLTLSFVCQAPSATAP